MTEAILIFSGANRIILEEAGVRPQNISVTNICTRCNPNLLYSHRIMGAQRGNLAAILMIREEKAKSTVNFS